MNSLPGSFSPTTPYSSPPLYHNSTEEDYPYPFQSSNGVETRITRYSPPPTSSPSSTPRNSHYSNDPTTYASHVPYNSSHVPYNASHVPYNSQHISHAPGYGFAAQQSRDTASNPDSTDTARKPLPFLQTLLPGGGRSETINGRPTFSIPQYPSHPTHVQGHYASPTMTNSSYPPPTMTNQFGAPTNQNCSITAANQRFNQSYGDVSSYNAYPRPSPTVQCGYPHSPVINLTYGPNGPVGTRGVTFADEYQHTQGPSQIFKALIDRTCAVTSSIYEQTKNYALVGALIYSGCKYAGY